MVATANGKEAALLALRDRRKESAKEGYRIDNSSLPAGSPMYFYCISCGCVADVLPESYNCQPRKLCEECQALKDLGWLNE